MAINAYICLNGEYLRATEPSIFPNNRAFRYADSLCENIHAFSTEPQFLNYHIERLVDNMCLLSMEVPTYFTESNINQLIVRLLNKNRIFGGAGIRLTVYRNIDEEYIPGDNNVSFILESYKLDYDKYELNEKGFCVDICSSFTKTSGRLANVRNANSLVYLLAGIYGRNCNLDAAILLNETGRLVETINANIFLTSGNSIFTPGISQGCIPGVMRKVITRLAGEAGFSINDQSSLTPAALEDAEEVFLTNAVDGIRWVGAFRQRRYFKKTAKLLTGKLNELAFKS
jgi:branched-subunit amino acid aminotransferase/4-amino-4-deoxychorismate lyase